MDITDAEVHSSDPHQSSGSSSTQSGDTARRSSFQIFKLEFTILIYVVSAYATVN